MCVAWHMCGVSRYAMHNVPLHYAHMILGTSIPKMGEHPNNDSAQEMLGVSPATYLHWYEESIASNNISNTFEDSKLITYNDYQYLSLRNPGLGHCYSFLMIIMIGPLLSIMLCWY